MLKGARVVIKSEMVESLQVGGYSSKWSSVCVRHHMIGGGNALFEVKIDWMTEERSSSQVII